MNAFCGGRMTGKTTKLIEEMKKNDGVLVVFTLNQGKDMMERFDLKKDQVVTLYQLMHSRMQDDRALYIDNVDYVLQSILKRRVSTVNFTGAAKKLKIPEEGKKYLEGMKATVSDREYRECAGEWV